MRTVWLIIKNKQILLIHRFCDGKEYYILPWWWVENHESIEDALIREMREEANLDIKIEKKLWGYKDDFDGRINHFFLITEFFWDLKLWWPESERDCESDRYILEWHDIKELKNLLFFPEDIKDKIVENFGF